ncbi:MAG: hypothetical protein WCO00_13420 [Rhodospirillaceae bacterium]
MNIKVVHKAVMLCDELGRHSIRCTTTAEAEKLWRRLTVDPDYANTMLRLCRPAEAEPQPMASS